MNAPRTNWATERIAGTAQVYEYDDCGVRFWIVACNREQADAVMAETNDPEEMTQYKVRVLDEASLRKMSMVDEDVLSVRILFDGFTSYCEIFATAGCLACTEE